MGKTFRRQKSWDDYDNSYDVRQKKKKFNKHNRTDKTKNLEELANSKEWDFRYNDWAKDD